MRKQTEVIECDICNKIIDTEVLTINYPVIFNTNQTDGSSCKPYISNKKLDLCNECRNDTLKVSGTGAQGHNTYVLLGN